MSLVGYLQNLEDVGLIYRYRIKLSTFDNIFSLQRLLGYGTALFDKFYFFVGLVLTSLLP